MNGRYGTVFTEIWQDRKFRKLSEGGKMLFLYLLSSPHGNMIGYYKLPVQYALHDLDLESPEDFHRYFTELQEQEIAYYDKEEEVVFIRNFLSRNTWQNPNQVKGAFKQLITAPYSIYMEDLIKALPKGLPVDCKLETEAIFNEKYRPFLKILGEEVKEGKEPHLVSKGFANPPHSNEKGFRDGSERVCNTEQKQNSNRTETEPCATVINFPTVQRDESLREFKVKMSLLLFRKELYNSEVGEQCLKIYQNLGDTTEALKRIELCSSRARSPDELFSFLQKENCETEQAVTAL